MHMVRNSTTSGAAGRSARPPKQPQSPGSWREFTDSLGSISKLTDPTAMPRLVVAFGPSDWLLIKVAQVVQNLWRRSSASGSISESSQDETALIAVEAAELDRDDFSALWEQSGLFDPASCALISRAERCADLGKFLGAIPSPAAMRSHLVILLGKDRLPAELGRQCERLGAHVIHCVEPPTPELPRFVAGLARRYGLNATSEALQMIVDAIGNDPAMLDNEVRRLALYWGDSSSALCARTIAPLLTVVRDEDRFRLDDLLLARDYANAHLLLERLLDRGESALALIGMLARHVRLALRIQEEITDSARTPVGAAGSYSASLRLPSFVLRKYTQYAGRMDRGQLLAALERCQEADIRIKSSRVPETLLLASVIDALTSPN